VSWFGGSGLVVRLDGYVVEGSFLDRIRRSGDPNAVAEQDPAAGYRRGFRWGVAVALIIALGFVITVAIRAAVRSDNHQRQVADAKFASIRVGMSPARVRDLFGSRPPVISTSKSTDFAETCWTYESPGTEYDICFQHRRVTSKVRHGT
jgi:hypothetical protein